MLRSSGRMVPIYLLAVLALACQPATRPKPAAGQAKTGMQGTQAAVEPAQAATDTALGAAVEPAEVQVTFLLPRGEVDRPAMGAVAFSEPMVALSALDLPTAITGVQIEPAVPLRFRWLSSTTLGFYPEQPLPGATAYRVRIAPGLQALSGRKLAQAVEWSFSTAPLRLVRSLPAHGQDDVSRTTEVVLLFSQQVDLANLRDALEVYHGDAKADGPVVELATGKTLLAAGKALALPVDDIAGKVAIARFVRPLPLGTQVGVHLPPGLRSLEGPLPSQAAQDVRFAVHGPFAVVSSGCEAPCDPDHYLPATVELSNTVADLDAKALRKLVAMTPQPPDFHVSCWARTCRVGGQLQPATRYQVTVGAGLGDRHGQKLGQSHTFAFETGHRSPYAYLADSGSILELGEKPHRLGLRVRNAPELKVRAHRLAIESLQAVLRDLQPEYGQEGEDAEGTAKAPPRAYTFEHTLTEQGSTKTDVEELRVVEVAQALGGDDRPGVLLLEIASPQVLGPDGKPQQDRRVLQVTDLHLQAKVADTGSVFWVTSYASGQPVEGVRLEVQGADGQMRWSGATNADGLATGPGLPVQPERGPPLLVARRDADVAFLRLGESTRHDGSVPGLDRGWGEAPGTLRTFVYTDKPVYRLGETVQIEGIVRALGRGGLELLPAGQAVELSVLDPQDRQVASTSARLGSQGTFHASATVPAWGSYGSYTVRGRIGADTFDTAFRVLVYRAPRFRIASTVDGRHHARGDRVGGDVTASWYTGGPLAGAPVSLSAFGSPEPFAPPGWDGFLFGPNTWDSEAPGAVNTLSQSVEGVLDPQGRWRWQLATQVALDRALKVEVEATARDPNGQPMNAGTGFWLHPAAHTVGVGLERGLVQAGQTVAVRLVAAAADGQAVPGVPVEVKLQRREWKSVRVKGMGDEWHWQTRKIDHDAGGCKTTSAAQPVACELQVAQPGYYVLTASGRDAQGRTTRTTTGFYAAGPGEVAWSPDEGEAPMLVADKASYKVGDVAKILIKNPFPGARAVLTEEREGVLKTRLLTLATSAETIEVPIEARHQPNLFVSVVAFAGRRTPAVQAGQDTGAPALRLGYLELPVDPADRKLQVQVEPSAPRARPGTEMAVTVHVRDAAGQPQPGEVTVFAVDEGVLALTGHATPDPFAALYARVEAGVRNHAAIGELMREPVGEEKGEDGGGGGEGSPGMFRAAFRDVAFFAPGLQADAQGRVTAKFTLPDNLTTYRIMAVAVHGPGRFGSGQAPVQVDKPLMLLASLPRKVAVGDAFEAALTARNPGQAAVAGKLVLELAGGVAVAGPTELALRLGPGESREIAFQLTAKSAGKATLAFVATLSSSASQAGGGDALREEVAVVDPQPTESVASYGIAHGPVTEALHKPAAIRADVGGLHLSAASSGLQGLERGIEWLVAYPYGCTEQVASQLLALLYVAQLNKDFKMFEDEAGRVRELADKAVGKLLDQRSDVQRGGFSLWPNGETSPAATAWALAVLHEASQRGHAVAPAVFKDGAAYLRTRLETERRGEHGSDLAFDAERALVLGALATLGQPAPGYLDELWARRDSLPPSAQVQLALAALLGDGARGKARAGEVVEALTRQLHVEGDQAHLQEPRDAALQWLWPSDVRTNAMLLDLMVRVEPGHAMAPRLARWLVQARRGDEHYGTTQDNAWALQGLVRWFGVAEASPPSYEWQALLGDRKLAGGRVEGRSVATTQAFVGQQELPAGQTALRIAHQGKGPLYYTLRYDYAPTVPATFGKNAGFFVRRTVVDAEGRTDRTSLRRGEHVLVTLTVVADAERAYVALVDQLPAGLEPVDFELQTGSAAMRRRFAAVQHGLLGQADDPFDGADVRSSPYSHRELAGREVRFFVDRLAPGLHTYAYVARAAVRGQFAGHGAKAETMYDPAVFGTSGAGRLTIE